MAELEQRATGDEGGGREWMVRALNARRDPAWTADGFVSERWLPVSPVSGRLDAFEWKDPLAGDAHGGAVIEAEGAGMLEARREEAAIPPPSRSTGEVARGSEKIGPTPDQRGSSQAEVFESEARPAGAGAQQPEPSAPASQEASLPVVRGTPRRCRSLHPIPVAPAVIPLGHAPDDPAPDPAAPTETDAGPAPEPCADNWSR